MRGFSPNWSPCKGPVLLASFEVQYEVKIDIETTEYVIKYSI